LAGGVRDGLVCFPTRVSSLGSFATIGFNSACALPAFVTLVGLDRSAAAEVSKMGSLDHLEPKQGGHVAVVEYLRSMGRCFR